jgi:hypothetical protein
MVRGPGAPGENNRAPEDDRERSNTVETSHMARETLTQTGGRGAGQAQPWTGAKPRRYDRERSSGAFAIHR